MQSQMTQNCMSSVLVFASVLCRCISVAKLSHEQFGHQLSEVFDLLVREARWKHNGPRSALCGGVGRVA